MLIKSSWLYSGSGVGSLTSMETMEVKEHSHIVIVYIM